MLIKIGWLALAGAAGTLMRYAVAGWVQAGLGAGFPWGTLAVNFAGCFVGGALTALVERQILLAPELRVTLMIGFLGAFTTFSSYILESGALLRDGEWALAALNFTLQNLGGAAALFSGFALARSL